MLKKLLLAVCFLSMASVANAEVYLLVNSTTDEVKDMSPRNDAVVEAGYKKVIIPGKVEDYDLQYHPSFFKYKNNKFVVNTKKISDEELAKQAKEEKAQEDALILQEMRSIAIKSLKDKGVEIKAEK